LRQQEEERRREKQRENLQERNRQQMAILQARVEHLQAQKQEMPVSILAECLGLALGLTLAILILSSAGSILGLDLEPLPLAVSLLLGILSIILMALLIPCVHNRNQVLSQIRSQNKPLDEEAKKVKKEIEALTKRCH